MKQFNHQQGFSIIDVMIAIMIMTIGILGAVAAITSSLIRSYDTERQIIAKQVADSTLESVFSARDIRKNNEVDAWDLIGNVGSNPVNGVPQGVFLNGFTPIRRDPGNDGIMGTIDDACPGTGACPNAPITTPALNTSEVLQGFQRSVVITDLETPGRPIATYGVLRRHIQITIKYEVSKSFREERSSTIITRYE